MKPKVSIIIPVYNVERYLAECLDSVLAQDFADFEAVTVDDGSTDGCTEILKKYAEHDPRICVIRQLNAGQSVARNRGLDEARGEWIYFLDSDDVMEAGALGWMVRNAEAEQLDILHFDRTVFYEAGVPHDPYEDRIYGHGQYRGVETGPELFVRMMRAGDWQACVWTRLFRTRFLRDNALYFHEGIIHEDEPYLPQTDLLAKRAERIQYSVCRRRVRAGSTMTGANAARHLAGYLAAHKDVAEFMRKHSFGPEILNILRRRQAAMMLSARHFYELIPEAERGEADRKFHKPELVQAFAAAEQFLREAEADDERNGRSWCQKLLSPFRCWKENGLRYTLKKLSGGRK